MRGKRCVGLVVVIALTLMAANCGSGPTPAPTEAALPANSTATSVRPIETPTQVPPADTATPMPPTDTPTLTPTPIPPTDTPTVTPTNTATPTHTSTPTPLPPTDTPLPTSTPLPPTPTPPPPTNTPVPPTPAPKPKPAATPTESPPPPLPAPTKGCYLFHNYLGVDVTVTLTAKDWTWNHSFTLAPNGEKLYCLDPGRYAYTLDAPPPWGSTNGDLDVSAGDLYLFPIRGG